MRQSTHPIYADRIAHFTIQFIALVIVCSSPCYEVFADEELETNFTESIQPFIKKYCNDCHSGESPEAKLDTSTITKIDHVRMSWDSWQAMTTRVSIGEMPPADSGTLPSKEEREQFERWTKSFRKSEAARTHGDPGPTSIRRLSNAELNYTIRDITGVDIQPTKSFPIDPANAAGFDNSAESLAMSPALVSKYVDAARLVADHMLLKPDGIGFAPFPVVTDTDRDKYCVQRIVRFYDAQPTDIAGYLYACWLIKLRSANAAEGFSGDDLISDVAKEIKLSPKYLRLVWSTLTASTDDIGLMKEVRAQWNDLPQLLDQAELVKDLCKNRIADYIQRERQWLKPKVENLRGPGMNGGSQSLVMWKNRTMASNRRSCRGDLIDALKDDLDEDDPLRKILESGDEEQINAIRRAYETFCSVFPDAFLIRERGRAHIDPEEAAREAKGRLLSAGFHSMTGFFRDDQPLCELILDDQELAELDRLWHEFRFVAMTPMRQYAGFLWFERAESSFINEPAFNFVRAEDKSANSTEMINRFKEAYVAKLHRREATENVISAAEFHFQDMDQQIRRLESELKAAEPLQIDALIAFAAKAYRRPLSDTEVEGLRSFYREARALPNSTHRSAMEDTLTFILVSPASLYRWDLQCSSDQVQELNSLELASRLSYFLWSSCPDEELLRVASENDLNGESLKRQLARMISDPRSRGMLREFVGNWLDFRRFDSHNGVDRQQFTSFDDELRQSMADEPVELMAELLNRNGSVMELLNADHIVVNRKLAEHYGCLEQFDAQDGSEWRRIDHAKALQRGGLIPMGVFLTQSSPGLRTSPVKRGYWVVRKLLGEDIPPPPPNVPELPDSEHNLGDLTLRELLAQHREHPSCAACHNRFDAVGLLLEGYDPIGRPRDTDLGGRKVAIDAELPNGEEASGLSGLQSYVLKNRADDFRRHFCASLLSYALGRTLQISDDVFLDQMVKHLADHDDKVMSCFELIVQSEQFRKKRPASLTMPTFAQGDNQ